VSRIHQYTLRVAYSDTDQGGIVHHTAYFRYLEAARIEMLRDYGVSYQALERELRAGLAVLEAQIRYISAARFDDMLRVETEIERLGAASLTLRNRIFRGEERLTEASITLVCIDLQQGRAKKLPPKLEEGLRAVLES